MCIDDVRSHTQAHTHTPAERDTAILSSKCDRSSASSGLKVAIKRGLHGYRTEIPSLSTFTQPSEMMLRRRLESSVSRRLMSSTYRTPLCVWVLYVQDLSLACMHNFEIDALGSNLGLLVDSLILCSPLYE